MRWSSTASAEIAGRSDESGSEMMQPDPVHKYPRGERVRRIHDGLGEFEPAASVTERPLRWIQHRQKAPRHRWARTIGIAAKEDPGRIRNRCIAKHHRP